MALENHKTVFSGFESSTKLNLVALKLPQHTVLWTKLSLMALKSSTKLISQRHVSYGKNVKHTLIPWMIH